MTYGAFTPGEFAPCASVRRSRAPVSQAVLCALALTLSAAAGLWILYGYQADDHSRSEAPQAPPQVAVRVPMSPPPRYSALLDPAAVWGHAPAPFAQSLPLSARFEPASEPEIALAVPPQVMPSPPLVAVRDIPLPTPRPAVLAAAEPPVGRRVALETPAAPAPPSFFDRMFGPAAPSGAALAYAAPEDGGFGLFGAARHVSPDHGTAIYDISAHTVTLPDGTRLEAHSGLGPAKDNPRSVTEHMRGATPPNVYELEPREGLFHGVAALRLNPVGGTTYGRGGLLAHSYMLGPRGDSNGCVVFKDYRAFRQAYDTGEVRRLVVVAGND